MSNSDSLKSRAERLKAKSTQAAVLNTFGAGDKPASDFIKAQNPQQNGAASGAAGDPGANAAAAGSADGAEVSEDVIGAPQTNNDLHSSNTNSNLNNPQSDLNDQASQNKDSNQLNGAPSDDNRATVTDHQDNIMTGGDQAQPGAAGSSQHYACFNCNETLSGQRYIIRDDNSYCISCYEKLFANHCEACSSIIGTDSKDLSYKDKHWHERCFNCSSCESSLVDKLFGSREDVLYCDNCYDDKFGAKCDRCSLVFKAGMKKLEWDNQQWHEDCFKCTNCDNVIGCNSFMPKDNQPYCIECFNDLFAPKCKKCTQPIMTGGVLYRNEPYHRNCFGCTKCDANLVGQKFTSRENQPYCADCFGELFAKRCTTCNKPITGIGGTKFISFDGRHWHNECFNCYGPGCTENLVGKGFITDQLEILCPNCAKLPYTKREELRGQQKEQEQTAPQPIEA